MKCKVLLVIVLCAGLCSGCFEELTATVGNLSQSVDVLQGTTKQLVVDGVIDSEKADKINANIDKVQKDVMAVKDAVATAKTLPEAVIKGIEASKPFNPFADEMNAILGLAVVLGGIFGTKKINATTKDKAVVENKYSAMKIGVEKTRNESTSNEAAVLYKNIGDARKAKGIA